MNTSPFDKEFNISEIDASLNRNNNGLEGCEALNTNNNVATQPRGSVTQASAPASKVNLATKSSNRNVNCPGATNIGELR